MFERDVACVNVWRRGAGCSRGIAMVGDSADRLDYVRMEAAARLAAWSVWVTANTKGRPEELGKQPGW